MYSCENIRFIRWGSLYQKKGKAINASDFHKAPADFGLYAFPNFLDESFLVNWKYSDKVEKKELNWINKKFGKNYKNIEEFYNDDTIGLSVDDKFNYLDSIPNFMKKIKNKDYKIFSYKGMVWHHFTDISKSPIRNGSWALDNYDDYVKILDKAITKIANQWSCRINVDAERINSKYAVLKFYSKDEFEVYLIDKIK